MTTAIEYALMAGASYVDTRDPINRFPTPQNWVSFNHQAGDSGFEAISFTNGNEIVISYGGTNPNSLIDGDNAANVGIKGVSIALNSEQPCHVAHALS